MIGTRAEDLPTCNQSAEMMALRDYVRGGDATRYDNQAEGLLRMDVTHSNLIQRWHDIKFEDTMTVGQVKDKLYRHGGTPAAHQELYLRRGGGDIIFLMEDHKPLKYYGARNGMEIHIKDTDPYSISKHGGLEDVSQVEKYNMKDDDYDKMENTVRACKRKEKAEAERRRAEAAARESAEGTGEELGGPLEPSPEELAAAFPLGSRCEVQPGARRGEVAYCGPVEGARGLFIGVRLDEPQGMNDGSKGDKKYFDCQGPKYGCFGRPEHVEVGDFPPVDPFASDDEF
jgi:tubulin-folding cofactor B